MEGREAVPDSRRQGIVFGSVGLLLAVVGLLAFNLGYIGLYLAFVPLLCVSALLFVEVGEDFFLALPLLAVTGTLLYAVGLFALPLIVTSMVLAAPLVVLLGRWGEGGVPSAVGQDPRPGLRALEFLTVLLGALIARYVLYRS